MAPKPTDRSSTQTYEDQRPEIKHSGVFPVCGFRVGFSHVGRNLTLQYVVPLLGIVENVGIACEMAQISYYWPMLKQLPVSGAIATPS